MTRGDDGARAAPGPPAPRPAPLGARRAEPGRLWPVRRSSSRGSLPSVPSGRQVVRWFAVGLAVLVPAVVWGVGTASAQASLGPHSARYEVTYDHLVTVDVGPLGTLVIDSPLPLTLGARVVVQEIPREFTALGGSSTLDALAGDLERYVQFFSAPEATAEVATRALVVDAVRRSALATLVLAGLVVAVRAALGPARRGELARHLRPHRTTVLGGTAVVVLVVATVTSSGTLTADDARERPASAVFDGTPLEGARITGRLAGVIDTYGGQVVEAYRENEEFYARSTENLRASWAERAEADVELARLRADVGLDAAPAGGSAEAPGGEEEADRGATPSPSAVDGVQDGTASDGVLAVDDAPEPVVLLVVTDLHCNVGMAPVIRAAAELSGASVVLNAGDTTVNGTAVESYCVQAFADAVPDGAQMVVANGNHDSSETAAQARAAGLRVLDGEVVEVAGVRLLGDSDPRETRVGTGTRLAGDETLDELTTRLADTACDDEAGVDLLLVHDVKAGAEALERGCVPAQVSGHYHRRIGPVREGQGVVYVNASTAGAALGQPTVGPLRDVAEMTVLRFDPEGRRVLDHRLVRVEPDASVTVSLAVDWPLALDTTPANPPGPAR